MADKYYGINGMGVLGRRLLLALIDKVSLVNDPNMDLKNLIYLLKYDSVYGQTYTTGNTIKEIQNGTTGDDEYLLINGNKIRVTHVTDTSLIPCTDAAVTTMIDCMKLSDETSIKNFITAGASRVLLPYGYTLNYPTISNGINLKSLPSDYAIISCGTAEMNAIGNILNGLNSSLSLSSVSATINSPYTNGQGIQDSATTTKGSFQQGRAAAWNITPATWGDSKRVGWMIPELNGVINGDICYIPVIAGGFIKLTMVTQKSVMVDDVNSMIKSLSGNVVAYTEDQLVSSDAVNTQVIGKGIKTIALAGMTSVLADSQTGGNVVTVGMIYDPIGLQVSNVANVLAYWDTL